MITTRAVFAALAAAAIAATSACSGPSLDGLPLEEAVDRHDAAAPAVSIPKGVGSSRTVSHLALIGLRPPDGSLHQYGMSPQRSGSSDTSPVLWLRRMTSSSWLGAAFQRGG